MGGGIYTTSIPVRVGARSAAEFHRPVEIEVAVTVLTERRWARIRCNCGNIEHQCWWSHQTYADLVNEAWQSGCGRLSGETSVPA